MNLASNPIPSLLKSTTPLPRGDAVVSSLPRCRYSPLMEEDVASMSCLASQHDSSHAVYRTTLDFAPHPPSSFSSMFFFQRQGVEPTHPCLTTTCLLAPSLAVSSGTRRRRSLVRERTEQCTKPRFEGRTSMSL